MAAHNSRMQFQYGAKQEELLPWYVWNKAMRLFWKEVLNLPLEKLFICDVDNHKHSVTPRWFCFQQEMGCKEVIIISKSNIKHVSDSAHQNKYAFLTTRMFRPQIRQFI